MWRSGDQSRVERCVRESLVDVVASDSERGFGCRAGKSGWDCRGRQRRVGYRIALLMGFSSRAVRAGPTQAWTEIWSMGDDRSVGWFGFGAAVALLPASFAACLLRFSLGLNFDSLSPVIRFSWNFLHLSHPFLRVCPVTPATTAVFLNFPLTRSFLRGFLPRLSGFFVCLCVFTHLSHSFVADGKLTFPTLT